MTNSEQICSELGKLYFLKELEKSDLVYINDFYNENNKILKNMRICEIIEEFKMLNLINLIFIKEEYIKVKYYKYVRHMEAIKQFRR